MSKILITGGAGYVGSHIVQRLVLQQDFRASDIVVFDNLSQGHKESLPEGVQFIQGDLRNFQDIAGLFAYNRISAVIHLAGMLNVAESMEKPEAYFTNNVVGGLHLLEAMRQSACRTIVFSSSCTVYAPSSEPVTEQSMCEPISPYGASKLQFEQWLQWYARVHQFKTVALRYFNAAGSAYGIGEWHEPEIHLIPSVLQAALGKRESFTIYGRDYDTPDGTCVRDFVHVLDLADAHVRALEYLRDQVPTFDVFNLGSGQGRSVQEIAYLAHEITGAHFQVRYAPRRPGDTPQAVADTSKATKQLGWEARRAIGQCIRDAWEWTSEKSTSIANA